MAANTEGPKLSGEIEGEGCPIQETRLHEDRKYEIRKSACKDRLGNTGQASKQARADRKRTRKNSRKHISRKGSR